MNNLPAGTASNVAVLRSLGALVTDQSARTVRIDNEGVPRDVELQWNAQEQCYGYFDAFDGFVVPPTEALCRYRVSFDWWLLWLSNHLRLVNAGRPQQIVRDHAWDLGDLWVTSHSKVPIVVACRVRGACLAQLRSALASRPGRTGGLLLTSGYRPNIEPAWPQRYVPVNMKDALRPSNMTWSIDLDVLKAPYIGAPQTASFELVSLSPDNRTFRIEDTILDIRGTKQQNLVRQLVDAFANRERRRTSKILSAAGYSSGSFDKALRGTALLKLLRKHIRSEKGHCWIEV